MKCQTCKTEIDPAGIYRTIHPGIYECETCYNADVNPPEDDETPFAHYLIIAIFIVIITSIIYLTF
jgi:hypothetical protein